jgi:hypothetical protein
MELAVMTDPQVLSALFDMVVVFAELSAASASASHFFFLMAIPKMTITVNSRLQSCGFVPADR